MREVKRVQLVKRARCENLQKFSAFIYKTGRGVISSGVRNKERFDGKARSEKTAKLGWLSRMRFLGHAFRDLITNGKNLTGIAVGARVSRSDSSNVAAAAVAAAADVFLRELLFKAPRVASRCLCDLARQRKNSGAKPRVSCSKGLAKLATRSYNKDAFLSRGHFP